MQQFESDPDGRTIAVLVEVLLHRRKDSRRLPSPGSLVPGRNPDPLSGYGTTLSCKPAQISGDPTRTGTTIPGLGTVLEARIASYLVRVAAKIGEPTVARFVFLKSNCRGQFNARIKKMKDGIAQSLHQKRSVR